MLLSLYSTVFPEGPLLACVPVNTLEEVPQGTLVKFTEEFFLKSIKFYWKSFSFILFTGNFGSINCTSND